MNKECSPRNRQKAKTTMTNRLANIATRQSKSRARDLVFAAFVALATVISVSTISTAADAASTQVVSR